MTTFHILCCPAWVQGFSALSAKVGWVGCASQVRWSFSVGYSLITTSFLQRRKVLSLEKERVIETEVMFHGFFPSIDNTNPQNYRYSVCSLVLKVFFFPSNHPTSIIWHSYLCSQWSMTSLNHFGSSLFRCINRRLTKYFQDKEKVEYIKILL